MAGFGIQIHCMTMEGGRNFIRQACTCRQEDELVQPAVGQAGLCNEDCQGPIGACQPHRRRHKRQIMWRLHAFQLPALLNPFVYKHRYVYIICTNPLQGLAPVHCQQTSVLQMCLSLCPQL